MNVGEKLLGKGLKKAPAVSPDKVADKVVKGEKGFIEMGNYLFEA